MDINELKRQPWYVPNSERYVKPNRYPRFELGDVADVVEGITALIFFVALFVFPIAVAILSVFGVI